MSPYLFKNSCSPKSGCLKLYGAFINIDTNLNSFRSNGQLERARKFSCEYWQAICRAIIAHIVKCTLFIAHIVKCTLFASVSWLSTGV